MTGRRNFCEHITKDEHVFYYRGEVDKLTNGKGFLVNKNIRNSVIG